MVALKLCLMCKQRVIASWESACSDCWRKLVEHDLCPMCHGSGTYAEHNHNGGFTNIMVCPTCKGEKYTGHWREWVITLNHIREILRSCGVDVLELHTLW